VVKREKKEREFELHLNRRTGGERGSKHQRKKKKREEKRERFWKGEKKMGPIRVQ